MLGTKSRCPGASSRVTAKRCVANFAYPTSTVTPLARSSGRESSAHAHEKDACAPINTHSVTHFNTHPVTGLYTHST
eukprot:4957146-Pyramimonas_sp.AAC.1